MIDYLTAERLDALVDQHQPPCVSMYVPMERKGAETQQNPLRLKAAIGEATDRLADAGMRRPDVEKLLDPVMRMVEDHDFLQHQEDGLAVFLCGDEAASFRLPIPFEPLVVVGDGFHIKPLFPFLSTDGEFYVLALSQNAVRLLRGSHWRVSELELAGAPKSIQDALWYKDLDASLQGHATQPRGGAVTYHGRGQGEEPSDDELKEFFRQVDSGVKTVVPDDKTPVVVAGVEHIQPLYREISDLHVLDDGVEGNPERLSVDELHERAWPLVSRIFQQRRDNASEQIGASNTSTSLDDVVMGAAQGRVETLFIPAGEQKWGTFDRDTLEVVEQDSDRETDLYDVAAVETWRHRGEVYVVDRAELPGEGQIAAVFRF